MSAKKKAVAAKAATISAVKVTPKKVTPAPIRVTFVTSRAMEHQKDGVVVQKDVEATLVRQVFDEADPLWHGTMTFQVRGAEAMLMFEPGKPFHVELSEA